jgi:hypothetical protein
MMLDPISANTPPAVPDAAPVRSPNLRPQTADLSTPAARSLTPVPAPAPETLEDIKLKLDGDNGVVLQFTDKKSGEVVRQIPSEQVLSVVKFIRQLLQEQETASANTSR